MDRRRFLTEVVAGLGLSALGCERLFTGPESRNSKVVYDSDPGGGGGGDNKLIGVFVTVGASTERYFVPRTPGLTVAQALEWAAAHQGLDVGFGYSPALQSRYVNRLSGFSVQPSDVPTLLYATGPTAFASEDDWYAALAGLYVDLQNAPPIDSIVDWRLAVP